MKKKIIRTILTLSFIFGLSLAAFAEMNSENYRIQNSVQSNGGIKIASNNFQMNSTVG